MRRLFRWWLDGPQVSNLGSAEGAWLSREGTAAIRAALDARGVNLTDRSPAGVVAADAESESKR